MIPLPRDKIERAAKVLSRSFRDDPKLSHSLPDRKSRERHGESVFRFLVRYGMRYGKVYATSPALEGAAIWLPSSKVEMTVWRTVRCGGIGIFLRLGIRPALEMLRVADLVEQVHRACAPPLYRYLFVLGVDPSHQKKGRGSRLLRETMRDFGDQQQPCFLETFAPENVPFYRRQGFHVVQEACLPGTDLTLWAMLRPGSVTAE